MRKSSTPKEILTIETLEKFERVINRDFKPYDLNMMVMPGTLEDKHKNCETIPALRRQFHLIYLQHVKKLDTTFTRSQQLAIRFKHLVEKHFVEIRSVSGYADKMNISAKHLSDIVQNEFGRGPLEIIHDMIFLEAKVLLKATNKSVSEIAHQLQFQDQ